MHRRASALVAASLLVLTAACGGEDVDTSATDPASEVDTTETTATETTATEEAAAGDDERVGADIIVSGADYSFEGLPTEIAAGSTVAFTNISEVEAHELVMFRLPDDEQRPVEELLEDFEPTGEPALVSVAGPGEDGQVFVGDGTITEPGRYVAVCFLPVGADPEEILNGDGPAETDAPPHAAKGMLAEVIVS